MQRMNPDPSLAETADRETIPLSRAHYRFPLCLVWTTIPLISWLLPFIGHVGIAPSDGRIFDFQGPMSIGVDNFAFGAPLKVVSLFTEAETKHSPPPGVLTPDEAIYRGSEEYTKQWWNLFTNNCHSHVARCLNLMQYQGRKNWNMVRVCWLLVKRGRYLSWGRVFATYVPAVLVYVALMVFCLALGIPLGLHKR